MSRTSTLAIAAALALVGLTGVPRCRTIDVAVAPGVVTLRGGVRGAAFGSALCAADLDGDGSEELVVGAPGSLAPGDAAPLGAVFVYTRRDLASPAETPVAARRVFRGTSGASRFGRALCAADIDGDGLHDLIVGAPDEGSGLNVGRGAVFIYRGDAGFIDGEGESVPAVVVGGAAGKRFGAAILVAPIGENGRSVLVVAAPGSGGPEAREVGRVALIPLSRLPAPGETLAVDAVASAVIEGESPGDALAGLAAADIDGDGRKELVLGAYCADGPEGEPDVGKLLATRVPAPSAEGGLGLDPAVVATVIGSIPRGFLGRSIAVGDIDADGLDDILVSAYAAGEDDREARGEAYVLYGGTLDPGETLTLPAPDVPRFTGSKWDLLGLPVLVADLNGDASEDILIASQFADGDERRRCGRVSVFLGSLPSVVLAKAGDPDLSDVTILGENPLDSLGGSMLVADLTGDAAVDVIMGAPDAKNGGRDAPAAGKVVILDGGLVRP